MMSEDDDFDDDRDCWNCGGEGYVYGCSWDWQCDTYDEGEGTCLCTRRCDVCNPKKLSDAEKAERAALQAVLAECGPNATNGSMFCAFIEDPAWSYAPLMLLAALFVALPMIGPSVLRDQENARAEAKETLQRLGLWGKVRNHE
jgi:hypothetical protein